MESMRFNVGGRVRIKSIDWYNENKGPFGELCPDFIVFLPSRSKYCGQIMTIKEVLRNSYNSDLIYYKMIEDDQLNDWTNGMIEGLVEEESSIDLTVKGEEVKERIEITIPEGYEYVIESGKIIFTKKKKEYPKTYEECCEIMDCAVHPYITANEPGIVSYYEDDLNRGVLSLRKLKICRDAYWKIAGEEMGLGKPWEPDYTNTNEKKFSIWVDFGEIKLGGPFTTTQMVLSFPTEEMRDAFKENFDPDIEICKEFL